MVVINFLESRVMAAADFDRKILMSLAEDQRAICIIPEMTPAIGFVVQFLLKMSMILILLNVIVKKKNNEKKNKHHSVVMFQIAVSFADYLSYRACVVPRPWLYVCSDIRIFFFTFWGVLFINRSKKKTTKRQWTRTVNSGKEGFTLTCAEIKLKWVDHLSCFVLHTSEDNILEVLYPHEGRS